MSAERDCPEYQRRWCYAAFDPESCRRGAVLLARYHPDCCVVLRTRAAARNTTRVAISEMDQRHAAATATELGTATGPHERVDRAHGIYPPELGLSVWPVNRLARSD